ncbi:hypothetical protein [Lentzea sp. E54]|uniref:hypothetical protein n=1 Tax=Lentzea xerophila TaxID=3435883 RepID=UPI003DA52341
MPDYGTRAPATEEAGLGNTAGNTTEGTTVVPATLSRGSTTTGVTTGFECGGGVTTGRPDGGTDAFTADGTEADGENSIGG